MCVNSTREKWEKPGELRKTRKWPIARGRTFTKARNIKYMCGDIISNDKNTEGVYAIVLCVVTKEYKFVKEIIPVAVKGASEIYLI